MSTDEEKAAAFAEKETAIKADAEKVEADRKALDVAQAAFAEREAATRKAGNEAFLEVLETEGRLAPGMRGPIAAFMETLDANDTVSFAESEDDQTPLDFFKDLMNQSGKVVEFGELANEGTKLLDSADTQALADAAVAFHEDQAAKGITVSFAQAVRQVKAEQG